MTVEPASAGAARQPKVSVLMLAYNHEAFIGQALDSVLAQKTSFDYEIVVGEDCSSDGTRKILLDYRERYPERIRVLLPERNLGMMGNLIATYEACCGEYVALLEGDDYWTSPDKLQRQVDYLESHPEAAECFHNAEVVTEGQPEETRLFLEEGIKETYTLADMVATNFIPTCSIMLRKALLPEFPSWFAGMPMGDWPLHILLAEKGTLGYLPQPMAAYRVHGGGTWSGSSRLAIIERSLRAARVINRHLGFRFDKQMRRSMAIWQVEATTLLQEQGSHRQAVKHAWQSMLLSSRHHRLLLKTLLRAATATVRGPRR